MTAALADVFPDDPPRFLARTPHGYHDTDAIARDAAQRRVRRDAARRHRDARAARAVVAAIPAIGYCQGTPLRNEIEQRDAGGLAAATEIAAARISARFGSGPVDGMIQAHVITAR